MHSKCKINKFTYWFFNNTNLIAFWFCSLFAPPSNCATIKLRFATLNLNTENAIVCLLQQLFELWLCQQQQNRFETENFPSEKFFMSYTASAYTHTHTHGWGKKMNPGRKLQNAGRFKYGESFRERATLPTSHYHLRKCIRHIQCKWNQKYGILLF